MTELQTPQRLGRWAMPRERTAPTREATAASG